MRRKRNLTSIKRVLLNLMIVRVTPKSKMTPSLLLLWVINEVANHQK